MENVKKFMDEVYGRELSVNAKGKIKATEATKIKYEFIEALMADLEDAGIETLPVKGMFYALIPHEDLGAVPMTVNPVMKSTKENYYQESEEYLEDLKDKEKKAADKKAQAAKDKAEKDAAKA